MEFVIITCTILLLSVFLTYKITKYLGLYIHWKPLLFCAVYALFINFIQPSFYLENENYHWLMFFMAIFAAASLLAIYNEKLDTLASAKIKASPIFLLSAREHQPSSLPALIVPTVLDRVKNDMENATLLKLTAVIAKLPSLDSILEYAYNQKRLKAYSNAIFALKQALDRYESDAYAPFIVIEIGNIYKNSGLYDEAIVIYKRAFSLPATKASKELFEEFHKNISYLRITKAILLQYGYTKLAFYQIPATILAEIDREFVHWRKKKYAS